MQCVLSFGKLNGKIEKAMESVRYAGGCRRRDGLNVYLIKAVHARDATIHNSKLSLSF